MRIKILSLGDDIAIIAQDEINLKRALESLDYILKSNYKIKINRKEREFVVYSKDLENINIKTDDDALTHVPKFKYIGL